MTSDDLDVAIHIASIAHRGQRDKGGAPYILHPLRVMFACETMEERVVAVLHDVIEDSGYKLDVLRDAFGGTVADAVDALSRRHGETYQEFIARCSANPLARKVKLADITDNMDLSRIPEPSPEDYSRMGRYRRAVATLENSRD